MTNKAVLISIRPKWCELIANGEKTVEIRKTRPKLEPPFRCYIYCSQTKRPYDDFISFVAEDGVIGFFGGGKVIGEFTCANILPIGRRGFDHNFDYCYLSLRDFGNDDIEPYIRAVRESRLSKSDLHNYAKDNPFLYAWQISDLEVYDTPKELNEFGLKRPPQSWCYVEELEGDDHAQE